VGEQSIGRARSMLIYALVRSGDMAAAKTEYQQLAGMPRPHPLLPPLREFMERSEAPVADAGVDAGDLTPEEAIRSANELRAKGDPKKAEEMLQEVLKKHPTNADAAVGLAEISRARNDMGTARRYYEQALKNNPAHLAALTGLADIKWDQNDRQGALPLYRKVVEVGGSTAYVAHARTRLGGPIPDDFITTPPTGAPPPTAPPTSTYTPPTPATTPTVAPPPTPTETTPPPPATTTPPPAPTPTNTNAPPIDFD
jgi:tetratricopeptide (TPR) repeat protein